MVSMVPGESSLRRLGCRPGQISMRTKPFFFWESQSTTTASSATGQRYVHHEAHGSRVLLFVREQRRQGTVTEPFVCLGFARYESHEGERIWLAAEWRSAGGWSGRFRRRGSR